MFWKKKKDKREEGACNTFSGVVHPKVPPHSSFHSLLSLSLSLSWLTVKRPGQEGKKQKNSPLSPQFLPTSGRGKKNHYLCGVYGILGTINSFFLNFSFQPKEWKYTSFLSISFLFLFFLPKSLQPKQSLTIF